MIRFGLPYYATNIRQKEGTAFAVMDVFIHGEHEFIGCTDKSPKDNIEATLLPGLADGGVFG